ncbi:hypothetical protein OSTOST_14858, partial [Ostertagia ostertagi]
MIAMLNTTSSSSDNTVMTYSSRIFQQTAESECGSPGLMNIQIFILTWMYYGYSSVLAQNPNENSSVIVENAETPTTQAAPQPPTPKQSTVAQLSEQWLVSVEIRLVVNLKSAARNLLEKTGDSPQRLSFNFSKHGVCIVTPDEQFKVVIYGNHLDKIAQLVFTPTNNCSDGRHVVDATNDFIVHFTHKVSITVTKYDYINSSLLATFHLILPMLPESIHAYKMCVKPKGALPGMELSPLDDISTWITTEKPPKEYFLPLPVQ